MSSNISVQKLSVLGFILCCAVIAGAFYLEYEYMLATCPLCILQRIVFGLLAIIFFFGSIFKFHGFAKYIYSFLILLVSSLGAAIASRQIWLQYLSPPQHASCAASLEQLIAIHPLFDALKISLIGSAECSVIDYTILGLSLAVWSFLLFLAMAMLSVFVIFMQKKRRI